VESKAAAIMQEVELRGGAVACVESGWFKAEIARSAWEYQQAIEKQEAVVVGLNKFTSSSQAAPAILKVDEQLERKQVEAVRQVRNRRDAKNAAHTLDRLKETAASGGNVVPAVIEAVEAYATVGEISDVFRSLYGEYHDAR
jgi:methylmalonyl-CoA mutase N-terminal domain/subunit